MTEDNTQIPRKRSTGARIVLFVSAGLASVIAVGALGLGAPALWGESEKDERGYLSTDTESFAAGTHAIATDNLDIDLDGAEELVDSTGLGDIRLDVESQADKPLFVGIARTDQVSSYLSGVSHTLVTDVDPVRGELQPPGRRARPGGPWRRANLGGVDAGPRPPDPDLGRRGR